MPEIEKILFKAGISIFSEDANSGEKMFMDVILSNNQSRASIRLLDCFQPSREDRKVVIGKLASQQISQLVSGPVFHNKDCTALQIAATAAIIVSDLRARQRATGETYLSHRSAEAIVRALCGRRLNTDLLWHSLKEQYSRLLHREPDYDEHPESLQVMCKAVR